MTSMGLVSALLIIALVLAIVSLFVPQHALRLLAASVALIVAALLLSDVWVE